MYKMHTLSIHVHGGNLSYIEISAKIYDLLDSIEYNQHHLTREEDRAFYKEFIREMEKSLTEGRLAISLQKELGEEYPTHTFEQIIDIEEEGLSIYVDERIEKGDKNIRECYKIDRAGLSYI